MHTKLSPDNPHGFNRNGFAWELTPAGGRAHLDFGCYHASFLGSLRSKGIERLVGVDISRDAVGAASEQNPDLDIRHIVQTVPLPFDDGAFDSITILEVVEHVHEQKALLDELHRILADGGVLIVTVPGKHLLSFLDLGNLKFRFPRLHRWYYSHKHSRAAYEARYVSNPDGLVGDISAKKRWHEQLSRDKLERLLRGSGFEVEEFDGTAYFARAISLMRMAVQGVGPLRSAVERIWEADARAFESTNLFCKARKRAR